MRISKAACFLFLVLVGSTLLTSTTFAARTAPFVVALPNGYEISRQRDSQLAIVKRTNRAVITTLSRYAVVRDVVTGLVPEGSKTTPGYFILKTDTGDLVQGLSEQDWKERLKALGVTLTPTLNAPILPG